MRLWVDEVRYEQDLPYTVWRTTLRTSEFSESGMTVGTPPLTAKDGGVSVIKVFQRFCDRERMH